MEGADVRSRNARGANAGSRVEEARRSTAPRFSALLRLVRAEFGALRAAVRDGDVERGGLAVEDGGARAGRGGDVAGDGVGVGRLLADDGDAAVAPGDVDALVRRIVRDVVGVGGDIEGG